MGEKRFFVIAVLAGCLPRPQPVQPAAPVQPPPAQPALAQVQPNQPLPQQNAAPPAAPDPSQPQPAQTQPAQPQPAQPGSYPPPQQPYPQQPQPYPQQGYPQQPYAQQPYPAYQYPPPSYPPPSYPPPSGVAIGASSGDTYHRYHDGEVIADFAVAGTLGAIDLVARQNISQGNAVTFIVLGGVAGGGGIGYLLANKYDIDAGTAHSTTLGMCLGVANAALLIQPTGWERPESVVNLLFLGSALGAGGGFAYGHAAKLTSGQSIFVANMALLGTATAALGAITGSTDGSYGTWENTTLALGIDGGTAAGMVVAPALDWSPRRAKIVMTGTVIGAFVGGMLGGLITPRNNGESRTNEGDVVTASMTAGLWGGFALGIMMTKHDAPDPMFTQPTRTSTASAPPSVMPWVGHQGAYGVMTGGSF